MTTRIINFHGVGAPKRPLEDGEAPYWISVDQYRLILDITASETLRGKAAFVFTFDDGNLSDLEIGAAELDARGLVAAFFPLAGRLDTPGSLSGADLRALLRAGHAVGSHGRDHVDWRRLDDAGARRELDEARATLAEAAGAEITTAAIPFGGYDRRTLDRLKTRGYARIYTSDGGDAEPSAWLQPRTSVRGDMTESDFRSILGGADGVARRLRRTAAMAKKRLF